MKDLNLLYVFEALWRDRSVTVAAENLGVSQAAVSASLKRLRNEYGDKLFTLVGRRMEPTPLAARVAPELLDAVNLVRSTASERVQFNPRESTRLFTLRTRDIVEAILLPKLLPALQKLAPNIHLRTVLSSQDEIQPALAHGRIDLAAGYLPGLEAGIHKSNLLVDHYVCVMRAGHPLADGNMTLKRFLSQEHLITEHTGTGHILLEKALKSAGLRDQVKLRIPQFLAAPYFIQHTDMIWTLPRLLAQQIALHFDVRIKPLPVTVADIEVGLYWHDRFHRDPANIWMRRTITDLFRETS